MRNWQGLTGRAGLFVALTLCLGAGCRPDGGNSNDGREEIAEVIMEVSMVPDRAGEAAEEPGAEETDELDASVGELARSPGNSRPSAEPYLRGKIVVIGGASAGRPYVDHRSMGRLEEIAAASPEEVQTVVLKDCSVRRLGFYRERGNPTREFPAFAMTCDVTIVDRAVGAAVYWKRFESKVNEETTADSIKNFDSMDSVLGEIDSYLKRLPRR